MSLDNDSLTGLYNEHYLQMIINQHEGHRSINVLLMRGFSRFNKENGWNAGSQLIKEFASYLKGAYSSAKLFRYHGDDFMILSDTEVAVDEKVLNSLNLLKDTGLRCEVAYFDLKSLADYEKFSLEYL